MENDRAATVFAQENPEMRTASPAMGTAGRREGWVPPPLVLPDYDGACIASLAPALLAGPGQRPSWVPAPLSVAAQVVVLVVDGLGWLQLQDRLNFTPVLGTLGGGPITTVAPTTTATALSSLTLGVPPAVHGVLGYKFAVDGPTGKEVLNVLRWSTSSGDARRFLPPREVQPEPAFGGRAVPVVSRVDFSGTGFSEAHQRGSREVGWVVPSSMSVLVGRLLSEGEPFVYAYYDGIDKVAHAHGLGPLYEAELVTVDRMVSDLLEVLPPGAALAVTADHGQVDVGRRAVPIGPGLAAKTELMSGEARFRWLHSAPGTAGELFDQASSLYGGEAWVATRDEVVSAGVFGGALSDEACARLGDVAIVPFGNNAYLDPSDLGEAKLVCRHGGLSPEEVVVPLLYG